MGKSAIILSIKKMEIIYKNKTKKHLHKYAMLAMFVPLFLVAFQFFGSAELVASMSKIYNPVNSLYSDSSDIVFTIANVQDRNLNFVVPIKGASVSIEEGDIRLSITNSIMVCAIEKGLVEEVGKTVDGTKYIKIKHSANIHSVIENLDIVGVERGKIVKSGQDIATAKVNSTVTLRIFYNNKQLKNLTINQSKIEWQN